MYEGCAVYLLTFFYRVFLCHGKDLLIYYIVLFVLFCYKAIPIHVHVRYFCLVSHHVLFSFYLIRNIVFAWQPLMFSLRRVSSNEMPSLIFQQMISILNWCCKSSGNELTLQMPRESNGKLFLPQMLGYWRVISGETNLRQ